MKTNKPNKASILKVSNIPTIAALRKSSHKVRVQRFRPYIVPSHVAPFPIFMDTENAKMNGLSKDDVYQNGGITVLSIRKPDGSEVRGMAECSLSDPFVKKNGVEIATARALNLPVPNF